ncbi:MAG: energy-coupling factor transporter transmembrane protein EcfT [Armatimonadetes bacterium]|nr:energy-coupling factor transporter transmembrane protein EcfT [Armatimonadota bacterium]
MLQKPSTRLGLLAVVMVATATAKLWPPWSFACVLAAAGVALGSTPGAWSVFLRRLRPLATFAVLAAILVLAAPVTPGEAAFSVPGWPRPISVRAANFVAGLWVKSAILVAWVTAAAAKFTDRDVLEGFLGLPVTRRLASILYFIVRSLQIVADELRRTQQARDARGQPRGLLRKLQVTAAMTQTLMVRIGRRAETTGLALAARGYNGSLRLLEVRRLEWAEAFLLLLIGGVLVWLVRL